jgi:hypothetical protein
VTIPHFRIVIGVCVFALVSYALVSVWGLLLANDPTLRGDIVGTWKSFAVSAVSFWLGSSSGGKARPNDGPIPSQEPQP